MMDTFITRLKKPVAEELDKEHERIQNRSKELAETTEMESYARQRKMQLDCHKAYDKFVAVEDNCNKLIVRNLRHMLHILKCVETGLQMCDKRYSVMFNEATMQIWINQMNQFNKLVKEHEKISHK